MLERGAEARAGSKHKRCCMDSTHQWPHGIDWIHVDLGRLQGQQTHKDSRTTSIPPSAMKQKRKPLDKGDNVISGNYRSLHCVVLREEIDPDQRCDLGYRTTLENRKLLFSKLDVKVF